MKPAEHFVFSFLVLAFFVSVKADLVDDSGCVSDPFSDPNKTYYCDTIVSFLKFMRRY